MPTTFFYFNNKKIHYLHAHLITSWLFRVLQSSYFIFPFLSHLHNKPRLTTRFIALLDVWCRIECANKKYDEIRCIDLEKKLEYFNSSAYS